MDFNLKAIFSADISNLKAGFGQVMTSLGEMKAESKLSGLGVATMFKGAGAGIANVGTALSLGVTAPLAAVGASAVKTGAEFDAQMNRVGALVEATGTDFERLRKQALDLGASSIFGAKEVAEAQEQLASAGFTANEILAATPGLIDLAAVSGKDMGLAAEAAASAVRQFGLDISETGHVADVYAKAAADTNAETRDMAEAMKYAGPVASSMGLSLEETAAAIGIMSNSGIKGSQAGTSLRGALIRLAKPSKDAATMLYQLGINAFDSSGKMKPIGQLLPEMKKSFSSLTEEQKMNAVATIFGQNAMSGMLALINSAPGELSDLTKGLENSTGAAQTMADQINSGLPGAIEEFSGAVETAKINIEDAAKGALTDFLGKITSLVDAFNQLAPAQQQQIVKWAGIAAAVGPAIFITGKFIQTTGGLIGKLIEAKKSFSLFIAGLGKMSGASGLASGGISGLLTSLSGFVVPVGIAIAVIGGLIAVFKTAWDNSETFRDTVTNAMNQVGEAFNRAKEVVGQALDRLGKAVGPFLSALKNLWDTVVGAITPALTVLANIAGNVLSIAFDVVGGIISTVIDVFSGLINLLTPVVNLISPIVQIVGGALAPAFQFLGDTINLLLEPIKWLLDALGSLKDGIGSVVGDITGAVGGAIDKVGGFFGGIADGISGFVGDLTGAKDQTQQTTGEIAESVGAMSVNASTKVTEMATSVIGQSQTMNTSVQEQMQTMATSASGAVGQMAQGMTLNFQMLALTVPEQTKIMANSVFATMQSMGITTEAQASELASSVNLNWDNLSNWTQADWEKMQGTVISSMGIASSTAQGQAGEMAQSISQSFGQVDTSADNAWQSVQSSVSKSMDASKSSALGSSDQINTGVSKSFESMNKDVSSVMSSMQKNVDSNMSTILSSAKKNLDQLASCFNSGFTSIADKVNSQMSTVANQIKSAMSKVSSITRSALSGLSQAFQQGFNAIGVSTTKSFTMMRTTVTQTMTAIKSQTTQGIAGLNQAVAQGVSGMVQKTSQGSQQIVQKIRSGLSSAVSSANSYRGAFSSAGYNLSSGLASGIYSGRSAVIRAAVSVAASAITAARRRLQIHSPSAVMEKQVGRYVPEGMAMGILNNVRSVEKAMSTVADTVSGADVPTVNVAQMFNSGLSEYQQFNSRSMEHGDAPRPLQLIAQMGPHAWEILVDDITEAQDGRTEAHVRYLGHGI